MIIFLLHFTPIVVVLFGNLEIIYIPLTQEDPKRFGTKCKKKNYCDADVHGKSKWFLDNGFSNHMT